MVQVGGDEAEPMDRKRKDRAEKLESHIGWT